MTKGMIISDIARHISSSKSVGIITHIMPDGDAIASVLALTLGLRKKGLHPIAIRNDVIPKEYGFLPGLNHLTDLDDLHEYPETLVVLDCGDIERLGQGCELATKAGTVINLDHHISNTMFGNLNLVDTGAAATGEIVYQLIKLMGIDMDVDIATCLYTAILTDTGGFKYDNTTWISHTIAGELITLGVKPNLVSQMVFDTRTLSKTKLIGKAIDTIKIYHDGKTAVMYVDRHMLEQAGSSRDELEGLINFARDIQGVEVAVLIKEVSDQQFKVGFRSKEYTDVSRIAGVFGGGGHKKAAGCTINGGLTAVRKKLLEEIENAYNRREGI